MASAKRRETRREGASPSLAAMVVASLVIHLVALGAFIIFPRVKPKRLFFAPVMTVSLVEPQLSQPSSQAPVKAVDNGPKETKKVVEKQAPAKSLAQKEMRVEEKKPRKEVQLARRLDLPEKAEPKRIPTPEAREIPRAPEGKPSPQVAKKEEPPSRSPTSQDVEERRRQWLEQQRKKEEALLAKSTEGWKGPSPREPVTVGPPSAIRGTGSLQPDVYNIKFKAYLMAVREKVRESWVLPDGLVDKASLTTVVVVKINRNGSLLSTRLEEGSGNRRYDETVLRAIAKAAPLPALPEEYQGEYMELGFRFRPEGVE